MSTHSAQGIVIKKMDYDHNDEIITILTSDQQLSFIALGTRKLTSKNRNALQLGNFVDVEYFKARLSNKLSKLKKATILVQPPIKLSDTALILVDLIKIFQFIQKPSKNLVNHVLEAYAHFGYDLNQHIKTFIYFNALESLGFKMNLNGCIECGRKDMIEDFEFYTGGFTCSLHSKNEKPLEYLKAIKNIDSFEQFSHTDVSIVEQIQKDIIIFIKENSYFKNTI